MNAVVGVVLAGASKTGALCPDHWRLAKAADTKRELAFFNIKKRGISCTICAIERRAA